MIDLTKLTPAPWECELRCPHLLTETHYVVTDQNGNVLFDALNSHVAEVEIDFGESRGEPYKAYRDVQGRVNLEAAAAGRNALDVMLRRGWHAEKCTDDNQWLVPQAFRALLDKHGIQIPDTGLGACYSRDPYSALLTADAYFKEHIDPKEPI